MELEEGLYAHLAANVTIGNLVSTRIYPLMIPQDVDLPAIAYQRVSGPRIGSHMGPSGLATARIQITCQAGSYAAVKGLWKAVRQALDGYNGMLGGGAGGSGGAGVRVQGIRIEDELDGWGMTAEIWTVRGDVVIFYREAV